MSDESKEDIRKILTVLDEYCNYHLDNCTLCVFRENGKCKFEIESGIENFVELLEEQEMDKYIKISDLKSKLNYIFRTYGVDKERSYK